MIVCYLKRFYNAIRFLIIPVVMDPHDSHAKVAPPHSFINVLDFPSIRDLADYLIKFDKNDAMYFWWKEQYKVRNGVLYSDLHYRTYCSLCAALHNPIHRPDIQVYWNMKTWWKDKSDCKTLKFDGANVQGANHHSPFIDALTEVKTPYGIESFHFVLKFLSKGLQTHRGKG